MYYVVGDNEMKLNNHGWGLSTMIGLMIAFVIVLIVIVILSYSVGAM
jgi:hypothetical protein